LINLFINIDGIGVKRVCTELLSGSRTLVVPINVANLAKHVEL